MRVRMLRMRSRVNPGTPSPIYALVQAITRRFCPNLVARP
jgi:hypothetical protein